MRVEIAVEVFSGQDALGDLLDLLRCFSEGRHDWVASPKAVQAAEVYLNTHASGVAAAYVDLARKGTVASAWSGDPGPSILRVDAENLRDLSADLRRSATLILEDIDSDRCFIRSITQVLGFARISRALDVGWLELRHGGGERLVVVAQGEAAVFRRQVRVVALLDSDRLTPGARTKAHEKEEALGRLGVVVRVLRLREAENYVPNRVLAAAGSPRVVARKLDLLKTLSREQRGHFDMKHGFGPSDGEPKIPDAQRGLYADLSPDVVKGLRGGFGRHLLAQMDSMRHVLRERDFDTVGETSSAELREVLAAVASVI